MKPMIISADLAVVVGKGPMPRSEVVKELWKYIKGKNLQDPKNKRNIIADEALKNARSFWPDAGVIRVKIRETKETVT